MFRTPPILILVLALTVSLSFACGSKTDAHATTVASNEPEIDAAEIASAFERDETTAARLYAGKRVRVAGYFASIEERPDGNLTLTLKTSLSTFRPVRCVMTPDAPLDDLEPGTPISVSGRVSGFGESTYYVLLEDCRRL